MSAEGESRREVDAAVCQQLAVGLNTRGIVVQLSATSFSSEHLDRLTYSMGKKGSFHRVKRPGPESFG
jgi:hypothetical protein